MVNFETTSEELQLIRKIAARVEASGAFPTYKRMDLDMDLEAAHSNGCPLNFQKLLDFPDFDFNHDIAGIRAHIDRSTGHLGDCFSPRCAKNQHYLTTPKLRIKIYGTGIVSFTTQNGNSYFTNDYGRRLWHKGILISEDFNVSGVSVATMRRRFLAVNL